MEAVLLQSSNSDSHHHRHQSISLNRNRFIQNPNDFISRSSSENFSPYPNIHGGAGGSTFYSAPSFYSSSVPIINQQQPPLLPLPITKKPYASLPLIPIRSNNNNNNRPHLPLIPSTPIRKNDNRSSSTRDQPDHNLYTSKKKSKSSSVISPKKQIQSITTVKGGDVNLMISSKRIGAEPCNIPKQVSRVMKQQPTAVEVVDMDEEFSGSIFALAPPPSSLPLPKFSMRPRLSCNVVAIGCAGIDNGAATDNLCRMLRLQ